jgi:hypothetical protein
MSPDLHPTVPFAQLGRLGEICLAALAAVVVAVSVWWAVTYARSTSSARPADPTSYQVRQG